MDRITIIITVVIIGINIGLHCLLA